MTKRFPLLVVLLAFSVIGCRAQVPPTNHTVTLTWSAPAASGSWAGCGAGQPACSYVISRAVVSGSSCPSTTGTSYTPLNQTSPATGTTFVDSTAAGLTACYIAQTLQGSAVSVPSNAAGPLAVPGNPLAPTINGQEAMKQTAPLPSGDVNAVELMARVK